MLQRIFARSLLLGILVLAACTDEDGSRRALEAQGFTEIELTGYNAFGCSDSDSFHTGFRAKNATGKVVEGVACCGVLKDCTLRV